MKIQQIALVSRNRHKLREIRMTLPAIEVIAIDELVPALSSMPAENASTFVENALIKAHFGATHCDLPVLADDSGLIVAALDGAPGVYSARYAGADADDLANCRKLLRCYARYKFERGRPQRVFLLFAGAVASSARSGPFHRRVQMAWPNRGGDERQKWLWL